MEDDDEDVDDLLADEISDDDEDEDDEEMDLTALMQASKRKAPQDSGAKGL
jgi:hypothetical protein